VATVRSQNTPEAADAVVKAANVAIVGWKKKSVRA